MIKNAKVELHNYHKQSNSKLPDIKCMKSLTNIPNSQIIEMDSQSPTSTTSCTHNIIYDIKLKAHKLYVKYIKTGSEYEINISSAQTQHITKILSDKNKLLNNSDLINISDLIILFNELKEEIKMLLSYSYSRFKLTNEYIRIVQLTPVVTN